MNRQRRPKSKLRLEKCIRWPIGGNNISATEFNTNTVPSETAISSSFASSTGPIAAIALPPQIAVPKLISSDCVFPTCSILPNNTPTLSANAMLIAVYMNPDAPACTTSLQVHPKAKANHRRLQQKLRELPALPMKGMDCTQPKRQPRRQRKRRPDQPAGRDYDSDIEKVLLPHT